MPIVMKSSDSGMVDPVTKTVRFPSSYQPKPKTDGWKKAAMKAAIAAVPLSVIATSAVSAMGDVTLTDPTDPLISVNVNTGSTGTLGLNSMTFNSVQQVQQQWFFYRIGASGTAQGINTISTATVVQPISSMANVTYSGATAGGQDFSVEVKYSLSGNGPDGASLGETVVVDNLSAAPLPFDLFQYNHFTLDNDTTHQTVSITPYANSTNAGNVNYNTATQTNQGMVLNNYTSGTIAGPDYYQAALYESSSTFFSDLGSSDLPGAANAAPGTYAFAGGTGGNVMWVNEWAWDGNAEAEIPAGGTEILSQEATLSIPEPSTAAMGLVAMSLLALRRRNRKTQV